MRVLAVDDRPRILKLLRTYLEVDGHEVFEADSNISAMEILNSTTLDLVISDVVMPDGSGLELLEQARHRFPDLGFIMISAEPSLEAATEALRLGAFDYLPKPFVRDELLQVVRRFGLFSEMISDRLRFELENRRFRSFLDQSAQQSSDDHRDALARRAVAYREAPVGLCLLDRELRYLEINRYLAEINGLSIEAHLGKKIGELMPDVSSRTIADMLEVIRTGEPIIGGLEVVSPQRPGERRHYEHWYFPHIVEGAVVGVAAVVQDVTDRKIVEAQIDGLELQIRHSQKLEAIGTLASGIAHEINNPLNVIMNYTELLGDEITDAEKDEFLGAIMAESERISAIVGNLLQFSRQRSERLADSSLREIIEQVTSLMAALLRRDQVNLEIDIPDGIPAIRCRSDQIQQVVMNLLTNARDSLNDRYPGYHENKRILIQANPAPDGTAVRLTVQDHGNGVPEAIRKVMFDPFFTTKGRDRGTGLGLSISHQIIEEHHGTMGLDDRFEDGARFVIELPTSASRLREHL